MSNELPASEMLHRGGNAHLDAELVRPVPLSVVAIRIPSRHQTSQSTLDLVETRPIAQEASARAKQGTHRYKGAFAFSPALFTI